MTHGPRQLTLFHDYAAQLTRDDAAIVDQAMKILERSLRRPGEVLEQPDAVANYLKLALSPRPHEVFVCLFLDTQHRLIEAREMFRGTLSQTSVYPREIVKEALRHNAAAVIFAHNHPSGVAEPSRADECLTERLKQALTLVDIRVLDHFIVAGMSCERRREHAWNWSV